MQLHAAGELQRQAAIARISPTPGPVLQVAQTFTPQQVRPSPSWLSDTSYKRGDVLVTRCSSELSFLGCFGFAIILLSLCRLAKMPYVLTHILSFPVKL